MANTAETYNPMEKEYKQVPFSQNNPMTRLTGQKIVEPIKPVSNVQARAAALNQRPPSTFGVGSRVTNLQPTSSMGLVSAPRRGSELEKAIQQQLSQVGTISTKPTQQTNTIPQQLQSTAANIVSTSTTPSVVAMERNTTLLKKDVEEIVNSIGLSNELLKERIIEKITSLTSSRKTQSKKYLINLAGHPAIQYYILQKEKLYFKEFESYRDKYKRDSDMQIKLNRELENKIAEEIAKLIIEGINSIGGTFNSFEYTFSGTVKPNPIFDPYFKIDFSEIEVPMNLGNTCKPPKQKAGTRRRIRGSRITKRRFN